MEFKPEEMIFREGECANQCYLIHHGAVALECHTQEKDLPIEIIRQGDVLGWSWLFPPFCWHFNARAIDPTITLQLNGARLLVISEEDDKLGHILMKRIAQTLVHRLQQTQRRLIESSKGVGKDLDVVL